MIDAVILAGVLNGHHILDVLHDTNRGMVATRRSADRTEFAIGDIMTYAAIDDLFLESRKRRSKRLYVLVRLPKQMQDEA